MSPAPRLAIILTVSLVLAPLVAEAQPAGKVYRVGFIAATSAFTSPDAFRHGLRELGYVEGQNVVIEQRLAEGQGERFPELVAEMLRLKVDVLVVGSPVGALAAKSATSTIPVVFAGVGDPVGQGIVASLARPGGNITGFSLGLGDGFAGKWVELLKEAVPHGSHLAVVWNSASPVTAKIVKEVRASAKVLKVRLHLVEVRNLTQFDSAFTTIAASNARGLIVTPDPLFARHATKLVQFAADRNLPAMYFFSDFGRIGGLVAYGPSLADSYRRAADYVDKILRGAKPADLPVQQPTTYELVINLKTAKALGLTIPQTLLLRADQVIE
jgi:putative ABC transport system substrate-binding protein